MPQPTSGAGDSPQQLPQQPNLNPDGNDNPFPAFGAFGFALVAYQPDLDGSQGTSIENSGASSQPNSGAGGPATGSHPD